MSVHPVIIGLCGSALVALQGWILVEIIGRKVTVAGLLCNRPRNPKGSAPLPVQSCEYLPPQLESEH